MRPQKHKHIVAIDPDVDKSGLAYLKTDTRELELKTLSFPMLAEYIGRLSGQLEAIGESPIIVIEASWLIRGNWHLEGYERRQRAASKGYDVGRNHETGRKIAEICRHLGLEVIEQYPLRKHWQGKDGKITHDELAYFTGITTRTNQETRDATLLAWHYAGLPIKVKTRGRLDSPALP